ncbi:MAG: Low specificity L-threonine aldolase [Pseudomonadota bacterium]|jgi:threonine aldolase
MQFLSDNTAPAAPEVMAALAAANQGPAMSYGADIWGARLDDAFSRFFGREVRAFPVATGTAANALALATLSPPWGAIYATDMAHVVNDECGAVELQTGGARLVPLPSRDGKLDPEVLTRVLAARAPSVHALLPSALSLATVTECGTLYSPRELTVLAAAAHARGLAVHLDGARFANALAAQQLPAATLSWEAGIDVMSFGATKNGALAAEAVVYFNLDLARDFERRRKRAAQLISKMRYPAAQLLACLEGDFFLANAARANALAARIGAAAGPRLLYPAEANMVFLRLRDDEAASLRSQGFGFHPWGSPTDGCHRFVVSWNQPESDVDTLCGALRAWT